MVPGIGAAKDKDVVSEENRKHWMVDGGNGSRESQVHGRDMPGRREKRQSKVLECLKHLDTGAHSEPVEDSMKRHHVRSECQEG